MWVPPSKLFIRQAFYCHYNLSFVKSGFRTHLKYFSAKMDQVEAAKKAAAYRAVDNHIHVRNVQSCHVGLSCDDSPDEMSEGFAEENGYPHDDKNPYRHNNDRWRASNT